MFLNKEGANSYNERHNLNVNNKLANIREPLSTHRRNAIRMTFAVGPIVAHFYMPTE